MSNKTIEPFRFGVGTAIVLIAVISFCIFGATQGYRQGQRFDQACRERGGIPERGKGIRLCLRPDQLIPMYGPTTNPATKQVPFESVPCNQSSIPL